MQENENNFGLIMPFLDKSETFVLGFECGQIWENCETSKSFDKKLIHTKNRAQIEMILIRYGYVYRFDIYDNDWCYLIGSKLN